MQIELKQEQKIEQFFEEYYRVKKWDKQSNDIVAGIFIMIQILLMVLPVHTLWEEENRWILLTSIGTLSFCAPLFYMASYRLVKEGQQNVQMLSQKIKYLPVDMRALKKWRIRLLLQWVEKSFLACMLIQLLFSLIIIHKISWMNVVYVSIVAFVIPMLSNGLLIWLEK
ncbi:MAG: hypothetical protein IJO85_08910 [Lachnospiraceae bacterium]|nr:hypothetical protein [Lachnospiraceae bacterium]